jgi:hypothetical protein
MKTFYIYAIAIILCLCFASFPQPGTNNFKFLTKNADVILTGQVILRQSEWTENKTKIITHVTLKIDEYLKGINTGNNVVVICPGGEVGDTGELYSHMPVFTDNENVLLFLKKSNNNQGYVVLNGREGKIILYDDDVTGDKITSASVKLSTIKNEIGNYLQTGQ